MVLNKKDLAKAFAPPNKLRKLNNRSFMTNSNVVSCDTDSSNVNVFVRVRPANEKEMSDNYRGVVKVVDEKLLVFDPQEEQQPFFFRGTRQKVRDIAKKQNKQLEFLFDGVFGPDVCNWDIHCKTTQNIIGSLLEGYNCSVFVYGATGAGKTFTMLGKKEHSPGIMYHTMAQLYQQIGSISQEKECHVGVSFVEVYNENVYDLLNPSGPLYLREDNSGVTIVGLKVENICNADQLLNKLAQGNNNRTQHPTDANAESSRSHAVFQVYVRMMARDDGQVKIAKLSMIDLAGSERGMATGCKGMRFKEGSNINKSLLALGNCISSLADNLRHVPYRDSKLTRLLKDSLGGNCQTVMIANISPSSASYEDTYNTLKFASRAKKITTKLTKNIISSDMGASHYMQLVDRLEAENTLLKSKMRALEKTATDSARAYMQMPDLTVWCDHLNELFDEKIKLCHRLLKIKSEAHLLEWRINYKNSIKEVIKSSQTNGSTVARIESSVRKYERSLNALRNCVADSNDQLKKNSDKLLKLFNEMEEARVFQYIKKDLDLKNALLRSTIHEVTSTYLTRLLLLQQRRAETSESALKMREPLLNDYHSLLSGLNMVTKNMAADYENAVSVMEGIKTVSWCDTDLENIESAGANVLSVVNLSFDDSLFLIDSNNQKLKLQPTILPITDMKDDETEVNVTSGNNNETGNDQLNVNESVVTTALEENSEENNEHLCKGGNSDLNDMNLNNDEDTANSTITLDMPSIPSSIQSIISSTTDDTMLLPQISNSTSDAVLTCPTVPGNLNNTVTIIADHETTYVHQTSSNKPDILPENELKDERVNSTFVKAKKNRPAFILPSALRKLNSKPLQKSNKENIMMMKNSVSKSAIKEKGKDIIFKQPIVKTPAVNKKQQPNDRISSSVRQALKPKSANVTISFQTASIPIMTPTVPSTQSLKIIHTKSRIKSHPYKRPEIISKATDKRR